MAKSDMPETAQYRMDIEKISRYRIQTAMEYPEDPEMVEELCQCGQVEELVQQADDEMLVLEMYLDTRMWELVSDSEIDIEYNPDPSKDEEGLDDDEEEKAK
jgi:NADH dehydrogenase (ubiquinone) 1 alpha subcomplex subunit 5